MTNYGDIEKMNHTAILKKPTRVIMERTMTGVFLSFKRCAVGRHEYQKSIKLTDGQLDKVTASLPTFSSP